MGAETETEIKLKTKRDNNKKKEEKNPENFIQNVRTKSVYFVVKLNFYTKK